MSKRRPRDGRPSDRGEAANRPLSARLRSPHAWLSTLALILLVAGARWWLIGGYSSDVPWLDQWDAEAQGLYQPWHAETLQPHNWFAPHNEHRIFFTRALALGLLWLNRQWDPRLEMAVNAVLYAMIFGALYFVLQKGRPPGFQIVCWVLLAVLGGAPYGSTNTLLGFQSQFYFLAGFSLLAIYALANCRPGSRWWIAGVVGGGAALVSMASGYAAALAVLGVLVCSALRSGKEVRQALVRNWMTAGAAAALIAGGVLLRYSPPGHESMAAKSVGDFAGFLLACLSWPGKPMLPIALVSWIPFAVFLAAYLRRQTKDDAVERFALGIGFWVLLQAAALALYRANSGEGLESRYTDILAFGLLANALCAMRLFDLGGKMRRWMPAVAAVWFAVTGSGLWAASFDGRAEAWKQAMEIRRGATAGYLVTGDERYLDRAPPYPDARHVAAILGDQGMMPILPAGIRKPLVLAPLNGSPTPGFLKGVSMPDFGNVPDDVWALPGMFARFAVIPPSTRFRYRVERKGGPPLLLMYFLGDGYDAAIADARREGHWIVPLPAGRDRQGHHAFAYCPAGECVLSGSSGATSLAIMEPKEIGAASIAALLAALWGQYVMAAGVLAFLADLLAPIAPRRQA